MSTGEPPVTAFGRIAARLAGAARAIGRGLLAFFRLFYQAGRLFLDSHAFDHAASLSFFAMLSITPFLILLISAAGYIALAIGPSSDMIESVVTEITDALQGFAPVQDEQVREVLRQVIERRGQFGLFGGLVMLLGASMVFGALEHAMEDIFEVTERRRFLVSRALFAALLVSAGFMTFIAHYAMTLGDSLMFAWHGATLDEWLRESAALDAVLTFLPVPVGFLLSLYLPGIVRPKFHRALAGAVIFFVLWEAVREGYSYYVTSIARFSVLYGSVATPILLILWTFYSANIFLFSVCCVSVLERKARKG